MDVNVNSSLTGIIQIFKKLINIESIFESLWTSTGKTWKSYLLHFLLINGINKWDNMMGWVWYLIQYWHKMIMKFLKKLCNFKLLVAYPSHLYGGLKYSSHYSNNQTFIAGLTQWQSHMLSFFESTLGSQHVIFLI